MSDPAAPWWAEVQHLRPRENHAPAESAPAPRTPSRRFERAAREPEAALATLEHEVADPWAGGADPAFGETAAGRAPWDEPRDTAWDVRGDESRDTAWDVRGDDPRDTAPAWDEPAADAPGTPVWDDSLEEAFARTPSWSDDDAWLLPKGADRIENGRRTIEIRGQVDRVHGFTTATDSSVATRSGRRPSRRAAARFERRPDRVAMWAFLLGLLLIVIAVFSKPGEADAAVRAAQPATAATAHVLVVETGDATLRSTAG